MKRPPGKPKYDESAVRERLAEGSILGRIAGSVEYQMRAADLAVASGAAPHARYVRDWMARSGVLPRELWGLPPGRAILTYALTVDPHRGAGWLRDAGLADAQGHLAGDLLLRDSLTAADIPSMAPRELPFQSKLDSSAVAQTLNAMAAKRGIDLGTPRELARQLDSIKQAAFADKVLAKRLKQDYRTDRRELLPPLDRHAAAKMRDDVNRRAHVETAVAAARAGPDRPRVSHSTRHAAVAVFVDAADGKVRPRQLDRSAVEHDRRLQRELRAPPGDAARSATASGRPSPGLRDAVAAAFESHAPETPDSPGEENGP